MRVPLGTGMWLCPKHRRATLWIKCRRVAAHGGKSSRLVTRSGLAAATCPRLTSRKLVKQMETERATSANLSSSVRTAFLGALRGGTRHEARSAVRSTRSSCFETFGTTSPKLLEPRNFKPRWWRNARDCKMPAALQQPLLEHWLSTTLTAETCCKALPSCAPRCAMAIKPPDWPCQRNGAVTRRREQRALTSCPGCELAHAKCQGCVAAVASWRPTRHTSGVSLPEIWSKARLTEFCHGPASRERGTCERDALSGDYFYKMLEKPSETQKESVNRHLTIPGADIFGDAKTSLRNSG